MTIAQALAAAVARLRAGGIADPARDARRLLAFALGVAPDRISLIQPDPMPEGAAEALERAIAARLQHQPVAQITGQREFFGRRFRVTRQVLDPRPETEALVLEALSQPAQRILDLGTGSGCILLSLLAEMPGATGVGADISSAALGVARTNAEALGLSDRAAFVHTDWTAGLSGFFDLIVSNPPYIAQDEMAGLSPDVRIWEPHLALSPGGDGLDAYRVILPGVRPLLTPQGRLLVEIGPTQAAAVTALAKASGYGEIRVVRDLDDRDRVVILRAEG